MLRIIVNARDAQDMRVAIINQEKQELNELFIETQQTKSLTKGNIYLGEITSIEPSLNACFVKYLKESPDNRHGFLPFNNLSTTIADPESDQPIHEQLKLGQPLLVQVEREARGSKGAALTNLISLAGSYIVLMPNKPGNIGISKRISSEKREIIKERLSSIDKPDHIGLIVRTAGINCSEKEYKWDLDILLHTWDEILKASAQSHAPQLIYQEQAGIDRIIRDHLKGETTEIITDDPQSYNDIVAFVQRTKPDFINKIQLHESDTPIFIHYKVEEKIKQIYQREIALPSGGTIVFDRTEALTAIDVNSAKATRASNIEDTAFRTNLEAARRIAEQIRLRDIGGLIVIDFIDMASDANKKKIEKELRTLTDQDSAQIYLTDISRFGLVEMSRQRIKPSIGDNHLITCSICEGRGFTRSIESLCGSMLQSIEQLAVDPSVHLIDVQLSPELCTYLINEKRSYLRKLEHRHNVDIIIIANPSYPSTKSQIKKGKTRSGATHHRLKDQGQQDLSFNKTPQVEKKALVRRKESNAPHRNSLLKRLIEKIFGKPKKVTKKKNAQRKRPGQKHHNQNRSHHKRRRTTSQNQRNRQHNKPRAERTKAEVDNQVL